MNKVSFSGGPVTVVADAPVLTGATWGPDNTIVFAPRINTGLWQVSADGGEPQEVTRLDLTKKESSHGWPQFLPGGKAIIFAIEISGKSFDEAKIVAHVLESGQRKVLIEGGTFARYLPTGHLVFSRSDALYAVKFDPDRLVVSGSPERVLTGVAFSGGRGISRYAVADNGALLYLPGGDTMWGNEIALLDREGKAQPLVQTPGAYFPSSLSPDGRFVAIPIASSNNDIWLFDTKRHTQTRLTFEGENARPTWSPDGRWLAYQSDESGQDEVYVQAFEGSGRRTPISVDGGSNPKWSPTGDELFFLNNNKMMAVKISTGTEMNAGRPQTLFELPPAGGPEAVRFDLART